MKLSTTALGLVLAAAAAPAAAQYGSIPPAQQQQTATAPQQQESKQPSIKPSNRALKAIVDLQAAVNKNDVASIPAKVAAAQAVASTKEDKYLIAQLQLKAALAAKDNARMAAAIDAVASSGYLDPGRTAQLYSSLGSTLFNAKQFDQAASAFERAAAIDSNNPDLLVNLGEVRFSQGRKADAITAFQRAIQAKSAAGQKAPEPLYKRAVSIAYDAQLPAAAELGRQWIAAYPSPDSWRNSIAIYRNLNKPDVEGTLDLLRLVRATGGMTSGDYSLYATAAADQFNYNEAQAVVDEGLAAKKVDPSNPLFRDIVAGLKAKQKATEADLATATKSAANGMALLRIGDRYYGMGQYAKAAELYRQAMGKPGVDKDVANLHIGMALARAGDKAGATSALSAVAGSRAEIAKYWLLYAQSRG